MKNFVYFEVDKTAYKKKTKRNKLRMKTILIKKKQLSLDYIPQLLLLFTFPPPKRVDHINDRVSH
jgi:hypothetical protein